MLILEPSAVSETAPERELPPSVSIESFTREERDAWMKDGVVPGEKPLGKEPDKKPTEAAPAPAGEDVAPPADDKSAQGKKEESGKDSGNKETAARIQELLKDRKEAREENKKLIARLEALEKGEKPAPPAEAKPDEKAKDPKDERPKRLSMEEFIAANPDKTWKDYEDYKDDYHEKLSDWKTRAAVKEALAERESKQAEKSTRESVMKAAEEKLERGLKDKDMPDLLKVVAGDKITAAIKKSGGVMGAFFDEVDRDCKIQYFLGSNLEEADRIAGLTPIGQSRVLNKLADKFYPEDGGKPEVEKEPEPESKPAPVPEKKLSAASAPPAKVNGNASVIEDEAKAALAAEDFRRFKMLEDQKDIERAKRTGR